MPAERLGHPIFSARSQSLSKFKIGEDARAGSCHKPRNWTKHAKTYDNQMLLALSYPLPRRFFASTWKENGSENGRNPSSANPLAHVGSTSPPVLRWPLCNLSAFRSNRGPNVLAKSSDLKQPEETWGASSRGDMRSQFQRRHEETMCGISPRKKKFYGYVRCPEPLE